MLGSIDSVPNSPSRLISQDPLVAVSRVSVFRLQTIDENNRKKEIQELSTSYYSAKSNLNF